MNAAFFRSAPKFPATAALASTGAELGLDVAFVELKRDGLAQPEPAAGEASTEATAE